MVSLGELLLGKLFGTDGIRGEANCFPMDGITSFCVGQATTHLLKKEGQKPLIIVGTDTRISGCMIEHAIGAGITSMGGDAFFTGTIPTPGIAFLTKDMRFCGGIMVSASHNPFQDNGIKIFSEKGFKLSEQQEDVIENFVLKNRFSDNDMASKNIGSVFNVDDAGGRYIVFLKQSLPGHLSIEGMKIVIDTANGATCQVAPDMFTELGANIEVIHNKPDGFNINDKCGSQFTGDTQKMVVKRGADIGISFDGDGDRFVAVDEKGNKLTGEQALLICAMTLKKEGLLKNNLLISTVMSNLGLRIACRKYDIKHHPSRVGDRNVLNDMQRLGAVLGGEQSGHMIFLEHHTTGDGIITAIQLIASMLKEAKPLSELATLMEMYPQKLINVEVRSKPEISTLPRVSDSIRQVESELGETGRVLVRYSGTQNLCRVMVEGPDTDLVERYCNQIAETVREAT